MMAQRLPELSKRFPQIDALLEAYGSDPSGILAPGGNRGKTARSLAGLMETASAEHIAAQLERLFGHAGDDLFSIFPTREELHDELLPLAGPLRREFDQQTSNLAFSSPAGDREAVSLNLLIRLYDQSGKVRIKIKIGIFADQGNELYWEVGFVDVNKSLQNIQRNFLSGDPSKGDYFLLFRLVECTKRFLGRRVKVCGLDLTPAYYHVVPLCLRLGGRAEKGFDWGAWKDQISRSFEHSWRMLPERVWGIDKGGLEALNRRYLISWLFEQGLMLEPGSEVPFPWNPPRLRCQPISQG